MANDKIIKTLLVENYDKYYRMAYSYVRNAQDAMDVVQEGACKALEKQKTIREVSYIDAWIGRIVIHTAIDFLRTHNRYEELPEEIAGKDVIGDSDSDANVTALLKLLEEPDRSIVLMRYLEEYKLEDISRLLEMNQNTVKAKLYRGLKKLKKQMKKEELV